MTQMRDLRMFFSVHMEAKPNHAGVVCMIEVFEILYCMEGMMFFGYRQAIGCIFKATSFEDMFGNVWGGDVANEYVQFLLGMLADAGVEASMDNHICMVVCGEAYWYHDGVLHRCWQLLSGDCHKELPFGKVLYTVPA